MLSLTRAYLFSIPLTFSLPFLFGEIGIWLAGPAAEVLMLLLTVAALRHNAGRTGQRLGVFVSPAK